MLQKNEIALPESLVSRELATDAVQVADVLVTHDQRAASQWQAILGDVGSAHAGNLHLHQCRVGRNVRKLQLAQLRVRWSHFHGS